MRVKCFRNLAWSIFLLCIAVNQVQAGQTKRNKGKWSEVSLRGRVVQINEEHRFVIINLGSFDGVKEGMVFSVFQKDEEAAKIKVAKVRKHISACNIQLVYTGRGIGVGDMAIYKDTAPLIKMFRPLEQTRMIEVEPIVVDIDAPKREIFKKALTVFKEFGIMIIESDSKSYTFKAHKYLDNPLNVDLLTEWGPNVKNKVFYNAEVNTTPRYNRLIISLRGVYDREGQLYNHEIRKNSLTYKQAQEMAFTIKDLVE